VGEGVLCGLDRQRDGRGCSGVHQEPGYRREHEVGQLQRNRALGGFSRKSGLKGGFSRDQTLQAICILISLHVS